MKNYLTVNLNYQNLFDYLANVAIFRGKNLEDMKIDASSSNNFYWLIDLGLNERKLVVKQQPNYNSLYKDEIIYQEWQIYNFFKFDNNLSYTSNLIAEILHFNSNNSILIYQIPKNYVSLTYYYRKSKNFSIFLAQLIGKSLAKMHTETRKSKKYCAFMARIQKNKLFYQLPYPNYIIKRIKPEDLKKLPVQSWSFLSFIQYSQAIKNAIIELVSHCRCYCLTHNNIRFNKIFIHTQWDELLSEKKYDDKSLIKFIDWDLCSWGDPAWDVGKAITGYLLFWVNSMVIHPSIEFKESLKSATIPLEVVHSSIVSMAKAYISTYPEILEAYPDFTKRIIQFAGLGLIYQLFEELERQIDNHTSQQEIYFKLATQLLCKPEKFLSI